MIDSFAEATSAFGFGACRVDLDLDFCCETSSAVESARAQPGKVRIMWTMSTCENTFDPRD